MREETYAERSTRHDREDHEAAKMAAKMAAAEARAHATADPGGPEGELLDRIYAIADGASHCLDPACSAETALCKIKALIEEAD